MTEVMSKRLISSSAAGVLSYLEEDDVSIKIKALQKLFAIVDIHWAEVCESLTLIEELSEDTSFPAYDLAAAIASKCFYHLQSYSDSLKLALSAGKYLDINVRSEYIETLLANCIDEYKALRMEQEGGDTNVIIDPRMENVIEQMFQRCYNDGCYEQAIGIALDTRRIDKLKECCQKAIDNDYEKVLGYTFNLCQGARNISNREFRLNVISSLVELYGMLENPDYSNVCFALQYLDRPFEVAQTLHRLCRGSDESALQAYQIAFDLQEAENQGFVLRIVESMKLLEAPDDDEVGIETSNGNGNNTNGGTPNLLDTTIGGEDVPAPASPVFLRRQSSVVCSDADFSLRLEKLKMILTESFDVDLLLNFLFKKSQADIQILDHIKKAIEGRTSVLHNATVIAHSYMYSGITNG
jgi:26S proteasome regulatory subunit N2